MSSASEQSALLRILCLAILTAAGAMLFVTSLPDRMSAVELKPFTATDRTHLREDLVFALQVELALRGFDPGAPDGVAGLRTRAAIHAFRVWEGGGGDEAVSEALLTALRRRP